jgi:hypothetical protein
MSHAWPTSDAPSGPLPRLEDLPAVEGGYEGDAVRAAFDSFYRHAAQLDASLRALEAVDAFRRDADALRNDMRALRSLAAGGSLGEAPWVSRSYDEPRTEVPGAALRLVAEAALIVAVAVVAGLSHQKTATIVALMAAAFVVVAFSEWLASRSRFVPPSLAVTPPDLDVPSRVVPAAPAWGPPPEPEPGEDTEPEALTVVALPEDLAEQNGDVPADDPWEQGPEADEEEPEAEAAERGGLFRRRRR